MTQILQVAAISLVTLGTGAATVTVMNKDIPDLVVPEGDWVAGSLLDGKTFEILGTDEGSGAILDGKIMFRDGTFQSADCEEYCNFGWSDYQTKIIDDVIHVTVTAICPDAPHTVVWYGIMVDDTIEFQVTWTTRRWYWTNQIAVSTGGVLVDGEEQTISG